MTTQQAQIILEIYQSGSISKAAKNLFLAQPNISNSLRLLEEELGFPIFVRSNRGVEPTECGIAVLEQAGVMWSSYQQMLHAGEKIGSCRVRIGGSSYTPMCEAYIKLCEEYQWEKKLDFSYAIYSFDEILDRFNMSALDLGVLAVPPALISQMTEKAQNRGFGLEVLDEVPVYLRIGPTHPLYNEPQIRLDDFKQYPCVDYIGSPIQHEGKMNDALVPDPDRTITTSDRTSKMEIVSRTCAYSVGSKLPADVTHRLKLRNIPLGNQKLSIVTFTRRDQTLPAPALRYLELLRNELAAL